MYPKAFMGYTNILKRLAVTRVAGQQAVLQRRTYLAPTAALRGL